MSLVVAAAACGADPGDIDSGGDVTLATLPADQRAAFDAWKARPIKDCLWAEAFPGLAKDALGEVPQATPHIDVTALYADTQGSPLIQGAGGEIVLLGLPIDDASAGRSELHTMYARDGQTTRSLSVSSVRDRGECVVTLGDQEVFRTRMAAGRRRAPAAIRGSAPQFALAGRLHPSSGSAASAAGCSSSRTMSRGSLSDTCSPRVRRARSWSRRCARRSVAPRLCGSARPLSHSSRCRGDARSTGAALGP